jgi:P22_AR N-terminal domain
LNDEYENEQEQEQEQPTQALIPVEQQTLTFHGLPLVVVRLPGGRPGVVLRWICENLGLAPTGQVTRIRRTEVIADDLVYVQVQTEGGAQSMPSLVLRSVPYWLGTIETRRMKDQEKRLEVLYYQREVVAALFEWASTRRPQKLVPAEPIVQPTPPGPGASIDEWILFHEQMASVLAWRRDVEQWQGSVESRLEGLEAIIPVILEQLPPLTISPAHQRQVQVYVKQLGDLTGKHPSTIYTDLYTAFSVPRYQDLPEAEWDNVEKWFQTQIDRARQRKKKP